MWQSAVEPSDSYRRHVADSVVEYGPIGSVDGIFNDIVSDGLPPVVCWFYP